ncbi:hypothetical protein Rsub_11172 [Raphidocelis subcapitata]|uniref:Uncharacterized protein n=1 Tax=Raphidocelis subcapitata TaxID=307507 RepID=A0A2V0PG45_9CHLO|nr:hypothetical protein Rsub_11172 [Raphidocelis subcapitata]|eukprot:GBF98766.1 hypothetical protein Rsub_11172 [Raphidocelis subcapitata]
MEVVGVLVAGAVAARMRQQGLRRELELTREELAAEQQQRGLLQVHVGELEIEVAELTEQRDAARADAAEAARERETAREAAAELTGQRDEAREERDTAHASWAEAAVAGDAAQGRLEAVAEELAATAAQLQAVQESYIVVEALEAEPAVPGAAQAAAPLPAAEATTDAESGDDESDFGSESSQDLLDSIANHHQQLHAADLQIALLQRQLAMAAQAAEARSNQWPRKAARAA